MRDRYTHCFMYMEISVIFALHCTEDKSLRNQIVVCLYRMPAADLST
jgi:hypothetical protein